MKRIFLIHYGEIGIKGNNRIAFETRLVSNIREQLKGLGVGAVTRKTGLITVDLGEADGAEVRRRLEWVPGIEYFYDAARTDATLPAIVAKALEDFKDADGSFRVTVKRSDKSFPGTSQEASAKIGEAILNANPKLKVDLQAPGRVCWVEITQGFAYVATEKIKGIGGLPVGSSSRLVSLLSGGIDSPVASWMMLKRGASLRYVSFHNFPYTDRRSIDIVTDLVGVLNRSGIKSEISFINLTSVQEEIVAKCEPRHRVVLYRRMMFRIAERIARRVGAKGFVTGESLGQVASQTIENISVVEAVTKMPILRPLIGMDKEEIIVKAKTIGTYELSIQPHSDCCSLFVPDNPVTKAKEELILADEAKLDVEKLIDDALKAEERIEIPKRTR